MYAECRRQLELQLLPDVTLLVPTALHYLARNFASSEHTRKLNYRRVVARPTRNRRQTLSTCKFRRARSAAGAVKHRKQQSQKTSLDTGCSGRITNSNRQQMLSIQRNIQRGAVQWFCDDDDDDGHNNYHDDDNNIVVTTYCCYYYEGCETVKLTLITTSGTCHNTHKHWHFFCRSRGGGRPLKSPGYILLYGDQQLTQWMLTFACAVCPAACDMWKCIFERSTNHAAMKQRPTDHPSLRAANLIVSENLAA